MRTAGGARTVAEASGRKRTRDRSGTEAELLAAARRLLARNGVLAGLNLNEVSEEAGVNRGLIYQYFGSRRALLRAALADKTRPRVRITMRERTMSFVDRRLAVWRRALKAEEFIKLEALLALDGDEDFKVFPLLDLTRHDLARDIEAGDFANEQEAMITQVMTTATYLGYCIFRETFVRDTGIPARQLDRQATVIYERMVKGLTRLASPRR